MAKAKIIKRKRRLRIEGIATLMFTIAIIAFVGARLGLSSYNYNLSIQSNNKKQEAIKLKAKVADLQNEVNNLQSRDRVLSAVEKSGIKTNQENIVDVKGDKDKGNE